MAQDRFPDRGRDGEGPDGSQLLPAGSGGPEARGPDSSGPQPGDGRHGPQDAGQVPSDALSGALRRTGSCYPDSP